ncbi:MAG TPA: altronate dehydratase family protein [Planctomycetia bacterium]|nr:altronate dehydratase family protein [Planctomycetia bacterium]
MTDPASNSVNAAAEPLLLLSPDDDVAVARRPQRAGAELTVAGRKLVVAAPLPAGHKIAVRPVAVGKPVRKYGQIIGFATKDIAPGDHVHGHNLDCGAYERDYAFAAAVPPPPLPTEERFFNGYLRADGRVGTRNYLVLASTVNCSATVCNAIADRFTKDVLKPYPNIDGVIALTHKGGCGMAASGFDRDSLQKTIGGYCKHPNVFDSIVIGLGCEVNQASELIDVQQLVGKGRPQRNFSIQGMGGIQNSIDAGVRQIGEMLAAANDVRRTKQSAKHLVLGTNCGGSDGASGVTANPALGVASDLLVAQGGTSILAETTEIYGAEHLLTRRAVSRAVGEKLIERIRWWESYAAMFGAKIDNNPSHGNKEGGLTTIFEKSLGAVAKAGASALVDVVGYADPVRTPGLVVMDTPGFDPVSVTGIVAGGANVVVFTTGRGSVFGSKPTPTIKISTNTPLYERMTDDMDLDAGTILAGEPVEVVGRRIFELILSVANGETTKSERQGVGDEEFAPWLIGPVL